MIEFSIKRTLREICLDSLFNKPVCINYKYSKKDPPEITIGFFAGYDDKYLYLSQEELDKPATKMSFLNRLLVGIDKVPLEDIISITVYTHATTYHIEKDNFQKPF